jgi:hypothetical protein
MPYSTEGGGLMFGKLYTIPAYVGPAQAVQLVADNRQPPYRTGVIIQVVGTGDVFLGGDTTITGSGATRGMRLFGTANPANGPDSTFTDSIISGPIWAVSVAGTTVWVTVIAPAGYVML